MMAIRKVKKMGDMGWKTDIMDKLDMGSGRNNPDAAINVGVDDLVETEKIAGEKEYNAFLEQKFKDDHRP